AMGDTIASLAKREFVLRQAGSHAATLLTSRWAMSYLRGPLTREQIATLMADQKAALAPPSAPTADAAPVEAAPADAAAPAAEPAGAAPADAAAPVVEQPLAEQSAVDDGSSPVMPTVAEGVPVRWLDPAAPWAAAIGAVATGLRHRAVVVATIDLLFDDTK